MKPTDLFKQLGLADSQLQSARELVYQSGANITPNTISLQEFVDTVYKVSVYKNQSVILENYMISEYFPHLCGDASDEYISNMIGRINLLQVGLPLIDNKHILKFLEILTEYVRVERYTLSKEVLQYLNVLYKEKVIK
jgi:hypothetical protein